MLPCKDRNFGGSANTVTKTGLRLSALIVLTMLMTGVASAKYVTCAEATYGSERWHQCCLEGRS